MFFFHFFLWLGPIGNPLIERVISLKELATLKVNSILARGVGTNVYKRDRVCVCTSSRRKQLLERNEGWPN